MSSARYRYELGSMQTRSAAHLQVEVGRKLRDGVLNLETAHGAKLVGEAHQDGQCDEDSAERLGADR